MGIFFLRQHPRVQTLLRDILTYEIITISIGLLCRIIIILYEIGIIKIHGKISDP